MTRWEFNENLLERLNQCRSMKIRRKITYPQRNPSFLVSQTKMNWKLCKQERNTKISRFGFKFKKKMGNFLKWFKKREKEGGITKTWQKSCSPKKKVGLELIKSRQIWQQILIGSHKILHNEIKFRSNSIWLQRHNEIKFRSNSIWLQKIHNQYDQITWNSVWSDQVGWRHHWNLSE